MARKKKHEEHINHEAWAIPYADLMTLLLAFFVVMYAISSLNEGKYKILSDALNSAFSGLPRDPNIVQFQQPPSQMSPAPIIPHTGKDVIASAAARLRTISQSPVQEGDVEHVTQQLNAVADDLDRALAKLIRARVISVRRSELWLEVDINSDILFDTGSAVLEAEARRILGDVAKVLASRPNQIRIEGYTDNRPINTVQFPSNWELSAARAASVVHLFSGLDIAPERMTMVGYGEYRPLAENTTVEGQGRNRRVILVILASSPQDGAQLQRLLLSEEAGPAPIASPIQLPPVAGRARGAGTGATTAQAPASTAAESASADIAAPLGDQ